MINIFAIALLRWGSTTWTSYCWMH